MRKERNGKEGTDAAADGAFGGCVGMTDGGKRTRDLDAVYGGVSGHLRRS